MWGRLEREARLLPQVLACSVSEDEVIVLVPPSADVEAVEHQVGGLVTGSGGSQRVRVIGGASRPAAAALQARRPSRSPLVLVGSVAATALLAASSLVAGIVQQEARPARPSTPSIAAGPDAIVERPFPFRPIRDSDASEPEPVTEVPSDEPRVVIPVAAVAPDPPAAPAVEPPEANADRASVPRVPEPTSEEEPVSCHEPAARGAPKEVRGRHRGNGPPAWSHSVLVEPHCGRGRPR